MATTTPGASTSNSTAAVAPAVTAVTIVTIPVVALSILNGMFAALANDDKFAKLCLSKDNWPVWSKKMLRIMKVSELDGYLFGRVPESDIAVDPLSHHHWIGNNNKLVGFLEMYVDDGELPSLLSDNAYKAWTNLLTRHEKQGPITQVRLIQEVLSISYSKNITTWQATTDRMRDLCACIYAQAVPSQDIMFMLAMLTGLEREADNIRSEMTSYYVSNKTAVSTVLSERIEQEIVYKIKCESPSSDTALAAQSGHRRNHNAHSTKICSNPICPHPNGHLASDCWEKGGAMEGKRDEVLARRTKAREERDKKKSDASSTTPSSGPSASGIRRDKSGWVYIVDSVSGQAILLASADDSSMPAMALAAFKPPTDSIYTSMSTTDCFEYDALFLDDHSASVNWCERRRSVSANDTLVASMNTNAHTNLSMRFGPFILDSGATIHISPDTSDFFDLKTYPPPNNQRNWRFIHQRHGHRQDPPSHRKRDRNYPRTCPICAGSFCSPHLCFRPQLWTTETCFPLRWKWMLAHEHLWCHYCLWKDLAHWKTPLHAQYGLSTCQTLVHRH